MAFAFLLKPLSMVENDRFSFVLRWASCSCSRPALPFSCR